MLKIQEFANHFGLVNFSGSLTSLEREILVVELDRPGLEISGFIDFYDNERLMLFGHKEIGFIETLSDEEKNRAFDVLTNETSPGIIVTQNLPCPRLLLDIAQKKDFPIFGTHLSTSNFFVEAINYLSEKLSKRISLHGCLLDVFGLGVLLVGESGIGKSEISLELIKKGHQLIADDKVDISLIRGKLRGTAPELLKGFMEVRGIGIIDCPRMFGINSLKDSATIRYIIKLVPYEKGVPLERLGIKPQFQEILGENIPIITIPVRAARSIAEIIEVAVTNYKLKNYGYDSSYEFENRMNELLTRKTK